MTDFPMGVSMISFRSSAPMRCQKYYLVPSLDYQWVETTVLPASCTEYPISPLHFSYLVGEVRSEDSFLESFGSLSVARTPASHTFRISRDYSLPYIFPSAYFLCARSAETVLSRQPALARSAFPCLSCNVDTTFTLYNINSIQSKYHSSLVDLHYFYRL